VYTVVIGLVLLASGAAEDTRRLFGFEKEEVEKITSAKRFDLNTPSAYQIHHSFSAQTADVTEGRWALVRTIGDRYGFLRPGNRTSYYIRHRTGLVLNTYGWFKRAMPADWSDFDAFRMDVKSDTVDLKVLLELEDAFIPDPVVRRYEVPAGKWVTLEVDLKQAARQRWLDLKTMAALRLIATEMGTLVRGAVVRVDNLRLVKAGAPNALPLLRDKSPMAAPVRKPGPVKPLDPVDIKAQKPLTGKPGIIDFTKCPRWRQPSYALLKVKERLLGGFGRSGIILVSGATSPHLSLDGGLTWQGLDGKPAVGRLLTDVRGHRATVLVDGRDVYVANIPGHCAGGGGRTELHFTRVLWKDGRWTVGPRVPLETGIRHCADRLSIVKTKAGRLWVAWNHLSRNAAYSIHAKYSDDVGLTWYDGGRNGLVGREGGGIPRGPYLTEWGDHVACVWRQREVMQWSHFDGKTWSPAVPIKRKAVPISVVTVGKDLYVATRRPAAVLRYDGKAWADDSPPVKTGLLTRCGDTLICVGTVTGEEGTDIVMCRKAPGGTWTEPRTIATETEKMAGLAVPQVSPCGDEGAFVPVAWSSVSKRWIKVLAVPLSLPGRGPG